MARHGLSGKSNMAVACATTRSALAISADTYELSLSSTSVERASLRMHAAHLTLPTARGAFEVIGGRGAEAGDEGGGGLVGGGKEAADLGDGRGQGDLLRTWSTHQSSSKTKNLRRSARSNGSASCHGYLAPIAPPQLDA